MSNEHTRLGIRNNLFTFSTLVLVNLFVGSMVGMERTILPLIGEQIFGLASASAVLSFIVSFGFSKAIVNYFAGRLAERYGRKKILLVGWCIGFIVPILVIVAHDWWVIIVANLFLGINQALTWSMTVNMKIDLVKSNERGHAIGLNEAAGYLGLSAAAALTGYIASVSSLRPEPFLWGLGFAIIGFLLSLTVKSTEKHLKLQNGAGSNQTEHSAIMVIKMVTWKDRTLSSCSISGLATNLKDGVAWGLFPLFLLDKGLTIGEIGGVVAAYPISWGLFQLITGTLSDRWGRKPLIVLGMIIQGFGLFSIAISNNYTAWMIEAAVLGLGTAMVYPTLQATISDVAGPIWRASAMGVYRFWRDSGYAFGALLAGVVADLMNPAAAITILAILPLASGIQSMIRMKESLIR
ncbi:MFS transporter [Cohnella sp.]|uniref:MFS transporter n=1 Tax=Cohnella sp. TaxID=1883426 RepID=UPI0035648E7C